MQFLNDFAAMMWATLKVMLATPYGWLTLIGVLATIAAKAIKGRRRA